MTSRDGRDTSGVRWRLSVIAALAAGVTAAIYLAGRLLQPDYTFSLFGTDPLPGKSALSTIALPLAGLQVLLALWLYRRLPLAAAPPRPVRPAHRITGAVLFAVTVPIALHCLIAHGVQLTSPRAAVHSVAGCFFYGTFAAKVLAVHSRRLPGWLLPLAGGTPPVKPRTTFTAGEPQAVSYARPAAPQIGRSARTGTLVGNRSRHRPFWII